MTGRFTKTTPTPKTPEISISLEEYTSPINGEEEESIHHPLLLQQQQNNKSNPIINSSRLNHLSSIRRRKLTCSSFKIYWIILLCLISLTLLFGLFRLSKSTFMKSTTNNINDINEDLDEDKILDSNKFPEKLIKSKTICSFCDCKTNRTSPTLFNFLLNKSHPSTSTFTKKSRHELLAGSKENFDRKSFLNHVWVSIRDIYCRHAWLGEGPALDLLEQTDLKKDIQRHIQWRLDLIEAGVPTAYLFTKTSWAGRTKHLRYAYFKRHILTIRTHIDTMKRTPWPQGQGNEEQPKRQLIWIIVEDGEKLANDVAQELVNTDVPFIYFTYGPTHHFGNAQQNAAYSLIHRLSDSEMGGVLGHGPVLSIDDDSNFLPELLVLIWKTKRIGIWPMGNLGPHGWEGPVYDPVNHTLIGWEAGAVKDRKFPIDNGAFSFSSDLLGSVIKGPRYWPTDISGGENEFIKLIVDKKEDLEPLCYNCHVAWHNEPLPPACTDLQICP